MNLDRRPEIVNLGAEDGVQGILLELPHSDLGNLCEREGWPKVLWEELKRARLNASIAQGLLRELSKDSPAQQPAVERWRSLLRSPESPSTESDQWSRHLLPVPVPLVDGRACLLSWSPRSTELLGIREAFSSAPRGETLDLEKQREYYAECTLGSLHGVDVADFRDPGEQELVPQLREMLEVERELICIVGRLDSFGTAEAHPLR